MAARRPLVLVSGVTQELPTADTVAGVATDPNLTVEQNERAFQLVVSNAAHNRTGVTTGLVPSAQTTPDMTVAISVGAYVNAGVAGNTSSVLTATITAADATNPRFDVISVSAAGLVVTAGTPAVTPAFPSPPANNAVLASVSVPANVTTITSTRVTDRRVILVPVQRAAQLDLAPTYGSVAALGESFPRMGTLVNIAVPTTTSRPFLVAVWLNAGVVVSALTVQVGNIAAVSPTNGWLALCDQSRKILRSTADQGTAAWTASTTKQLALSSTFTTTYGGLYYAAICVTASTLPTVVGVTGTSTGASALLALVPALNGLSSTVSAAPAADGTVLGSLASSLLMPYVAVQA